MRGEFRSAWRDFVDQVLGRMSLEWGPPTEWERDLCFSTANAILDGSIDKQNLLSALERPDEVMDLLWGVDPSSFVSEARACRAVPALFEVCGEYDDELAETFREYTRDFVQRFSLRYSVSDACQLAITTTGLVASLVETVDRLGEKSPTVRARLDDVSESIADVEGDPTNERRIREAIRNQFLLVEELAKSCSTTTRHTLGDMCAEIDDWPHKTYGKALSTLYGFRSDFPAMGHAGNHASANRKLDARDVASMASILFGFAPYLVDELDSSAGWRAPSEVTL